MITGKNRFVFVAPMFNASETLERMLHSIYGQSYTNWHIVLIDDVSSAEHVKRSRDILNVFERFHTFDLKYDPLAIDDSWTIPVRPNAHQGQKVTAIFNDEKKWETANVLHGIKMGPGFHGCKDDDIICRIDADDWLTDLDALAIINSAYEQTGCDALWTAHRWSYSDKNISGQMPDGADPYKYPWVSSHLKTFRKRLLNDVPDMNFRNESGEYVRRCGDQAVYLPVLHRAKKRVFLPRVMYHYTIKDEPATYQTDDAKFQRDEAVFLRNRGYVDSQS